MRITSAGHAAFAAVLIALGLVGLIEGVLVPVWAPIPKDTPAGDVLAYACAIVSLAAGACLVARVTAGHAARVLLAALVVWLLAFRVRAIAAAPGSFEAWDGGAETLAIVAGAWALYARLATGLVTGVAGARLARILLGLAMIPFGVAHLRYIDQTAPLVPSYVPAPEVVAYATGIAFLLASAALLSGILARLAAVLATVQVAGFTVLVWVPIVATGSPHAFDWSEFGISTAITAAAWVVAESAPRLHHRPA